MLAPSPELMPDEPPLDHAAVRTIVVGILLAMSLSALDQTIVGPALPTIGRSLGTGEVAESLSWVVSAYLLASTAVTPLYGKLSDIYGRRAIMLIAIGVFIIGSVACALAPNLPTLIAARALQGLGGGGLLPLAQTIISDLMPPKERPRYQTYTAAMFTASSVIGPVIGGVFAEHLHWSLIFWINLPLGAVAFLMTNSVLKRLPRRERPHDLDVGGAVLMVGAAVTVMLALTWGGVRYPWMSAPVLGLIAGSAILWALFALRLAHAPEPFIPPSVMRDRVVATALVAGFFAIGAVIGLAVYFPVYIELVLGASASLSGLMMIAFMGGTTAGSIVASRVMGRARRYKWPVLVGLVVSIATLLLLAFLPVKLPMGALAALIFVFGTGAGTVYPMTTIVIQNVVLPYQTGTATGTLNLFRALGGALIVAGFGALVLGGGAMPHGAPVAGITTGDTGAAFAAVFVAAAVCLALAFVAVVAMPERPLRGRPTPGPMAAQ